MKITYFTRGGGGCDQYRVMTPLDEVRRQGLAQVTRLTRGDDAESIAKVISFGADVFVFPRPGDPHSCGLVHDLKKYGKVVVEYDDDVFSLSPFSPHYAEHGIEDVKVTLPGGDVVDLWKDGQNIDLKRNRENMAAVKECLAAADMLTVTTDRLADRYREYNPNVVVLQNCVDLEVWKRLPLTRAKSQEIRMGWFGGASHYEDWALLTQVLPEVLRREPRLTLVLMGMKFPGTLKGIPEDRIEFHPWVPTPAYPYKAAILDLDFAVIPLRDTPFNRCKSAIKWVEMGALGVPAVTSHVPPYSDIATEENGLFVDSNDVEAWKEGLLQMAQDPIGRLRFGAEAKHYVAQNFDIRKNAHRWFDAYRSLGVK